MRNLRSSVSAVAWALILTMVIGCGASARDTAIRATFVTVNSVRDGFTTFDKDRQAQIVAAATSAEGGVAALAAYRVERDQLLVILDDVYHALTLAIIGSDAASLTSAQQLAVKLKQAYDTLQKVKHP
jgi:hypothetical protein